MSRRNLLALAFLLSAGCGAASPAGQSGAPPLAGKSTEGGDFSLSDDAGEPLVLLFVRGAFCPVCLERLKAASAYAGAYSDAGARLVGVTLDPPDAARAVADSLGLKLPVVSVDTVTFRRWGVWPAESSMPRPGDFVLDSAGRIRWSRIGADAADRPSDVALLGILDSLRGAGALARR